MRPETTVWQVSTMRKLAIGCGLVTVLAIFLAAAVGQVGVQMLATLMFGWWGYLARVVPRVRVSRAGVLTVLLCGGLFTLGLHGFLRWLHLGLVGGPRRWRVRWTLSIVSVVVLMFAAGIATVGVTHQTAWLISSKKPLTSSRASLYGGDRTFEYNLRSIAMAVHNYSSANDALPGDRPAYGRAWPSWQTASVLYHYNTGPIDFRYAYDDPANSAIYRAVVPDYLNPKATVLRDERGYALSHVAGNIHVFGRGRSLKMDEVGDLSHTMLAGEVASGFKSWGDPTNLRDPGRPFDGSPQAFGSPSGGGATVVMMDGSVKFISDRADPKVLRALCGRRY